MLRLIKKQCQKHYGDYTKFSNCHFNGRLAGIITSLTNAISEINERLCLLNLEIVLRVTATKAEPEAESKMRAFFEYYASFHGINIEDLSVEVDIDGDIIFSEIGSEYGNIIYTEIGRIKYD